MKNVMTVFPDTKIYIFCPYGLTTGGPEALHQLRYYMEQMGYDAYLVYDFTGKTDFPARYAEYAPRVLPCLQTEDAERNILIVPEVNLGIAGEYRHIRKCVWFLSWGYFRQQQRRAFSHACKNAAKRILNAFSRGERRYHPVSFPAKIGRDILCCCGSVYAREHVLSDLGAERAELLVEPISLDFLSAGVAPNLTSEGRSDTVLYNPAKPSAVMQALLARGDISFCPLKGYTPQELIALYRRSKLYIDFGWFGGPERIPKESVYNGTCLLVGRRNAAENAFDVAIPEQFKVADYENAELIAQKIRDILQNYDKYIGMFAAYRAQIGGLEANFRKQIAEIFHKEDE